MAETRRADWHSGGELAFGQAGCGRHATRHFTDHLDLSYSDRPRLHLRQGSGQPLDVSDRRPFLTIERLRRHPRPAGYLTLSVLDPADHQHTGDHGSIFLLVNSMTLIGMSSQGLVTSQTLLRTGFLIPVTFLGIRTGPGLFKFSKPAKSKPQYFGC